MVLAVHGFGANGGSYVNAGFPISTWLGLQGNLSSHFRNILIPTGQSWRGWEGYCFFSVSKIGDPPSTGVSAFFCNFLGPSSGEESFLGVCRGRAPIFHFHPFQFTRPSAQGPATRHSSGSGVSGWTGSFLRFYGGVLGVVRPSHGGSGWGVGLLVGGQVSH